MMRVQTYLYSTPVITLTQNDSIHDALLLMQKNEIKRLVISENNFPLGIVTERDIGKFLEKDKTTRALNEIPLSQIMTRNPVTITVGQEDHLIQCAIRMETFQICAVIVVDDSGNLVGITTKSDLAKNFANLYVGIYKIKDYMTRKLITCRKSDSLLYVLNMLNKNKIARIVVTDNYGKPIGLVTYDLFMKNSEYLKLSKRTDTRNYLLPKGSKDMQVGELLGNELLTIESEEDLAKAAKLMSLYKVSGIPTVDKEGNLEGVITSTDITRAYSEVETHARLIKKDPHFV
ncbi:MAG TPA: CBS domain-containing protein [Nitrosopumilaceae archaeon]|nr:CBS domain-containing protein [Nitrosopumilaceae archaeon]